MVFHNCLPEKLLHHNDPYRRGILTMLQKHHSELRQTHVRKRYPETKLQNPQDRHLFLRLLPEHPQGRNNHTL